MPVPLSLLPLAGDVQRNLKFWEGAIPPPPPAMSRARVDYLSADKLMALWSYFQRLCACQNRLHARKTLIVRWCGDERTCDLAHLG